MLLVFVVIVAWLLLSMINAHFNATIVAVVAMVLYNFNYPDRKRSGNCFERLDADGDPDHAIRPAEGHRPRPV
jgi:hypothetical protein